MTETHVKRECQCDDWKENIDKINRWQLMSYLHIGLSDEVNIKPFRFCPWCGKRLITKLSEFSETNQEEGYK